MRAEGIPAGSDPLRHRAGRDGASERLTGPYPTSSLYPPAEVGVNCSTIIIPFRVNGLVLGKVQPLNNRLVETTEYIPFYQTG